MSFRVGQKVVCINSRGWRDHNGHFSKGPAKGQVCLITGIAFYQNPDETGLELADFDDDYLSICFRPVVERKIDISIFTQMLTDNKVMA